MNIHDGNLLSSEAAAEWARLTATEGNPEDLADVLDVVSIDVSTPEAMARQTSVISTISELAMEGSITEGLYHNLIMDPIPIPSK